ncbi:uncharacterized protein BO88DRAFT_227673 [Aspergillus vadensis CBS 113365]|uniref:Uncharacterized protein n=1 Tax=Aspergillus vadensis (strain CBS 113365 / IMI 142717 / IBT 24658) TaxID=1448311 RepID=A0A319BZR4_ASPVC|nr:hypothetical protein BO88DRAFT_227673 [Aspergillus vadensis CBS 113365]PYH71413.1 hypothetical protein BO88DRAFT_227673 [Aspergillus vadensis CBS 113365]
MKNHALGYKTEQNTRKRPCNGFVSFFRLVTQPLLLSTIVTLSLLHAPLFPLSLRPRTSPLQSLDGATQRLLFLPRTMTQGMHRRQREHTQRRCWAVYSIINTCWREQVFNNRGRGYICREIKH